MNNTSLWLFWLLYLCFGTFVALQTYWQFFLLAIMRHFPISVLLITFLITLKNSLERMWNTIILFYWRLLSSYWFRGVLLGWKVPLDSVFILFLICGGLFWLICFFVIRILRKYAICLWFFQASWINIWEKSETG